MERIRRSTVATMLAVVTLGSWTSTSAATPPDHHTLELHETHVIAETPCGFPIQEHIHGTERVSVHYDGDGNMARLRVHGSNLRIVLTNMDNGKTVESVLAGTTHVEFGDDDTDTVRITGLHGHLVVPGDGVVEQESGMVLLASMGPGDPDPTVEQLAGRFDGQPGPFPELCAVLGDEA